MNFKAYLAGILTGAMCMLAGYMISHANIAAADANGSAPNGFTIATPPTGANEKLIYVWDSTDPTKPSLSIYSVEGGKDLQLRSHRNCQYDKLFDSYEMGGKPDSPEDMKKRFDAIKK